MSKDGRSAYRAVAFIDEYSGMKRLYEERISRLEERIHEKQSEQEMDSQAA